MNLVSHATQPSGWRHDLRFFFALAYEIAVPNFNEKTHLLLQTISFYLCFYLLIFSLSIVNELPAVAAAGAVV